MATIRIPVRNISLVGILLLGACSQSKEPSYEVSPAALAQYANTCAGCHGEGLGGAPITGDAEDWAARVSKGMRTVYKNSIDGFEGATGIMPARGGYPELTDEEVNAIVDYMIDVSR